MYGKGTIKKIILNGESHYLPKKNVDDEIFDPKK